MSIYSEKVVSNNTGNLSLAKPSVKGCKTFIALIQNFFKELINL